MNTKLNYHFYNILQALNRIATRPQSDAFLTSIIRIKFEKFAINYRKIVDKIRHKGHNLIVNV